MSLDRDPTPVGAWRQVTKPLYSRRECQSWADHINDRGESEAKIMRCHDELGRPAWAVFALRKPVKQKVGRKMKMK